MIDQSDKHHSVLGADAFGQAVRVVLWTNLRQFLKFMIFPMLAMLMLEALLAFGVLIIFQAEDIGWLDPYYSIISLIVVTVLILQLALSTIRYVLIDDTPSSVLRTRSGFEEGKYFLEAMLLLGLVASPLTILLLLGITYQVNPGEHAALGGYVAIRFMTWTIYVGGAYAQYLPLALYFMTISMIWALLRLLPFFSASAIDVSMPFMARVKAAWVRSEGTQLRFLIVLFATTFPLMLPAVFYYAVLFMGSLSIPIIDGFNIGLVVLNLGHHFALFFFVIVLSIVIARYYGQNTDREEDL